jgi:hypothetical protein
MHELKMWNSFLLLFIYGEVDVHFDHSIVG